MNRYFEEPRSRGQTLLIVEGHHEKQELFQLLFRCFPEIKISMEHIWIYGTNIYLLYEDIVKEYGEAWSNDDIDLPFVLSKKQNLPILRYKENFTNIILVFDYERHDANFAEDKIQKMQTFFSDAADMGKLYINYPMIESYQHLKCLPDPDYLGRKIPVSLQPGRKYKSLVKAESILAERLFFPTRLEDLLARHYQISDPLLRKSCWELLLSIQRAADLNDQIHGILSPCADTPQLYTAIHQIKHLILKVGYPQQNRTYWQSMRDIFKQILRHNIHKALYLQGLAGPTDFDLTKESFEQIDLSQILTIQNQASRDSSTGFIWVLSTCIFFVAEYRFSLIVP